MTPLKTNPIYAAITLWIWLYMTLNSQPCANSSSSKVTSTFNNRKLLKQQLIYALNTPSILIYSYFTHSIVNFEGRITKTIANYTVKFSYLCYCSTMNRFNQKNKTIMTKKINFFKKYTF